MRTNKRANRDEDDEDAVDGLGGIIAPAGGDCASIRCKASRSIKPSSVTWKRAIGIWCKSRG